MTPLLRIEGLEVHLPDGRPLLRGVDLEVAPGEVVAILGQSGSGKSTLGRALFEPEMLRRQGFRVKSSVLEMERAALVPQHGAPFDHLDVLGNVSLALRWREDGGVGVPDAADWLRRVGLPDTVTAPGTPTAGLSGGQCQRLAIARALAGGRALLFLDEPSAGLDTLAAAQLGTLLRERAEAENASVVLVTHDTLLAAQSADRHLLLDPATGRLIPIETDRGDREGLERALREKLEAQGVSADEPHRPSSALSRRAAGLWTHTLAPLRMPALVLSELPRTRARTVSGLLRVAARVLGQSLLRPALFYAVVAALLGFTILYVLVRAAPSGLSSARLLELVGGSYVLALAPPLSAILFVATSGSAVNAWLGSMTLGRQVAALRALGVRIENYLWLPTFLTLSFAFVCTALIISAGMIAGGAALYGLEEVTDTLGQTLALLAGDLLDPVPERARLRARAMWLIAIYAPGIAADVVHRGTDFKRSSDDVTRSMTGSVIACTLWVVVLELVSALVLFATRGAL